MLCVANRYRYPGQCIRSRSIATELPLHALVTGVRSCETIYHGTTLQLLLLAGMLEVLAREQHSKTFHSYAIFRTGTPSGPRFPQRLGMLYLPSEVDAPDIFIGNMRRKTEVISACVISADRVGSQVPSLRRRSSCCPSSLV